MTPAAGAPAIAAACLAAAEGAGAAAADVFIKESATREVAHPEEAVRESSENGVALRVFLHDGRSALAATTVPGGTRAGGAGEGAARGDAGGAAPFAADALAHRAVEAAACSSPGQVPGLPGASRHDGRGLGLFDPDIEGSSEDLLESALQIADLVTRAVAGAEARVRLHAVASTTHLLNSAGFAGSYRQTMARLDLEVTLRRGADAAATRVVRAARSLRGLAADSAASEAAALIEERLAPRVPPSGIHEVLLSPRAAAEIVAALAAWLARGSPRRGSRIGSQALTLTDDGRLPGGVASAPFDGEGTRTRRTPLVERGIVRDLLRDLEGGLAGDGSTGNGVRASFREAPALRPTNLFLNPGAASPQDLLASVRQGIRISTLGRIPPVSALDAPFTAPFTGRWIHNGRLEAPLGGGYLAGTMREILAEAQAAASDLTFSHLRGSFGAPSILIRRAPVRSS